MHDNSALYHQEVHRPLWLRILRYAAIGIGALLALLLLLVICLFVIPSDWLRGVAGREGSSYLGRSFVIDGPVNIKWDWTTPHVTASDIHMGNPEGFTDANMLDIKQLDFKIKIWKLLLGEIQLPEITIAAPVVSLEKVGETKNNWDIPAFSKAAVVTTAVLPSNRHNFPVIGNISIKDGHFKYKDTEKKLNLDLKISSAQGEDAQGAFTVAGVGSLLGKPFNIDAKGGALDLLRQSDKPYPLKLDLVMGPTKALIEGSFKDPIKMAGIDARLDVKGENLADIYYLTSIPLPPSRPYTLSGHLTQNDKLWTFEEFKGRVGDSDMQGNLVYDTAKERGVVKADLHSNRLAMDDLAGFIGAAPDASKTQGLSEKQKALAAQQAASDNILPDVPINLARLRAADMDVKLKATKLDAPNLPFNDLEVRFLLNDGVLTLDPLKFGMAQGKVSGTLVLDGSKDIPRVTSDLSLHRLSLKQFFKDSRFAPLTTGFIGGRFQLAGNGKSLAKVLAESDGHVSMVMAGGTVSLLLVEAAGLDLSEAAPLLLGKDKATTIRCAVGDFDVKNGMLRSDIFVFDTKDSNINGSASINLKDETINAKVEAHPKDDTAISARSPILIDGKLKKPSIGLDPAALGTKAAIAAALAVVATPLAAIIPFIDIGDGKNADCGHLLQQAKSH